MLLWGQCNSNLLSKEIDFLVEEGNVSWQTFIVKVKLVSFLCKPSRVKFSRIF